MTEATLQSFVDKFGPEIGPVVMSSPGMRRLMRRQHFAKLKAAMDQANAEHAARAAKLAPELAPLRAAVEKRYAEYLRALEVVTAKEAEHGAVLAPLAQKINELWASLNAEPHFDIPGAWEATERLQWQSTDAAPGAGDTIQMTKKAASERRE